MNVCGQFHDQKEAYMTIFLPGYICFWALLAMLLLYMHLHSLNCGSSVISIFYLLHISVYQNFKTDNLLIYIVCDVFVAYIFAFLKVCFICIQCLIFASFHDAILHNFPSVIILFVKISKLTICGQNVKCCHPFSVKSDCIWRCTCHVMLVKLACCSKVALVNTL